MIVVMHPAASEEDIAHVLERLAELSLTGHVSTGVERTVIGVVGPTSAIPPSLQDMLETLTGVEEVLQVAQPYRLAGRTFKKHDTVIEVGGVSIGGGETVVMAGPCSIESEDHVVDTARAVRAAGAHILRGGAFKPRTSPYAFRGLGEEGLRHLATARQETGLPVITEVMTVRDVDLVAQHADILQVGARNMQNFILLDEIGKVKRPVMLKRGLAGEIQEWLLAAEYIMAQGNHQVMLCERGIRTFETMTRNTMDISAIPLAKRLSHLPVIADPSHGTGKWYLVEPMAMAAVAAGADGLMIEVHPSPDHALSDGAQSLTYENFGTLMVKLAAVGKATGKPLACASTGESRV
jgi:3-deoxy-7-phosphoheptulonate synthase